MSVTSHRNIFIWIRLCVVAIRWTTSITDSQHIGHRPRCWCRFHVHGRRSTLTALRLLDQLRRQRWRYNQVDPDYSWISRVPPVDKRGWCSTLNFFVSLVWVYVIGLGRYWFYNTDTEFRLQYQIELSLVYNFSDGKLITWECPIE